MMGRVTGPSFDSFAQNGEDVVLWRALGHIRHGRYVDVGANHPTNDSVTRAFYNRGWRGIAIEPVPSYAELFRQERPGDIVIEAAITAKAGDTAILHEVPGTGLSTLVDEFRDHHEQAGRQTHDREVATRTLDEVLDEAGWGGADIHFVTVDTEGGEQGVLAGFDLERWQPWVLVIEATAPDTTRGTYQEWEEMVTAAGYRLCLFDGLSRFYLHPGHTNLADALSYGACVLDAYTTLAHRNLLGDIMRSDDKARKLGENLEDRTDEVVRWRAVALTRWADAMAATAPPPPDPEELQHLRAELAAMYQTVSWRVTKPLRVVRGWAGSARARR
jgi:FkbM family methyltransferase